MGLQKVVMEQEELMKGKAGKRAMTVYRTKGRPMAPTTAGIRGSLE